MLIAPLINLLAIGFRGVRSVWSGHFLRSPVPTGFPYYIIWDLATVSLIELCQTCINIQISFVIKLVRSIQD